MATRPPFGDLERIRKRAVSKVDDDGVSFIRRWWTEKYKLPAEHKLFQQRSLGALVQELYSDWAYELQEIERQLADPAVTDRVALQERQHSLSAILSGNLEDLETGFDPAHDPEVDAWIEQIQRGEAPAYQKWLSRA